MNKTLGNRDRRIAMLLIAAFAWLFIGSLVIFHEEQVLGKHFNVNIEAFVSPKSKDKQGFAVELRSPLVKMYDNGGITGILTPETHSAGNCYALEIKPKQTSSFCQDKDILNFFPLRAPPTA
jgi:hypothetical protein